jgi:cation diffusion facilitator CzcD-associated flavoprotein CzcO
MAGILSAIRLQGDGIEDFTVYEKADRLGGTWRENTYPGLCCDVPSHLYCYSFAPNPEWSHVLSPGAEILGYFKTIAARYGIGKYVRLGDEVVGCEFTEGRWRLTTTSGHHDEVDVVIAATGVLHHPKYPDIEGLYTFGGAMFHSSRWDHSVPLDGARLGIVGTGSTAVQIVSAIVDRTARLTLFQRTAQWVMPSPNPAYTEAERHAFRTDPHTVDQLRSELSSLFDLFSGAIVDADSEGMKMIEAACRSNLEDHVLDPALREKLRPDYRAACKRLIVSANFYDAIQRPHAQVITEPISGVEPRPEAYLSISVPGFPNFFMLNGPNGPIGNFSLIEVAELQLGYIMRIVDRLSSGPCREITPTRAALDEFEAARSEAAKKTVWATGCRSWYLDDRGIPAAWPWPFPRFRDEMAQPKWEAYELLS